MKVRDRIRGSYALGIIHEEQPDKIICTRKESPLIIGLGKDKNFIASDVPAILKYTRDVIFLENDEIAVIEEGNRGAACCCRKNSGSLYKTRWKSRFWKSI